VGTRKAMNSIKDMLRDYLDFNRGEILTKEPRNPSFELTIPGKRDIINVYEGKTGEGDSHNAYRAIESFLPYRNGTVIIYIDKQYRDFFGAELTSTMTLKDREGEEFNYCLVGKEVLNLQKEKVLINSGRREIKVVMPWPLYSLPIYVHFHLVLRGVVL